MSLNYTTKQRDTMMVVIPNDTADGPEIIMEFVDSVLEQSQKLNLNMILLDLRLLIVHMEHAGAYEIAAKCVERMSEDRRLRVAVVSRPERMEFARIYESIGFNRGVDIKAFESEKMAASWLTM